MDPITFEILRHRLWMINDEQGKIAVRISGSPLVYEVKDFSASLLKNIRWHERYNVQFRVEALNFANHANFGNPGTALGSAAFGVIGAGKDPRTMQLGLRTEF